MKIRCPECHSVSVVQDDLEIGRRVLCFCGTKFALGKDCIEPGFDLRDIISRAGENPQLKKGEPRRRKNKEVDDPFQSWAEEIAEGLQQNVGDGAAGHFNLWKRYSSPDRYQVAIGALEGIAMAVEEGGADRWIEHVGAAISKMERKVSIREKPPAYLRWAGAISVYLDLCFGISMDWLFFCGVITRKAGEVTGRLDYLVSGEDPGEGAAAGELQKLVERGETLDLEDDFSVWRWAGQVMAFFEASGHRYAAKLPSDLTGTANHSGVDIAGRVLGTLGAAGLAWDDGLEPGGRETIIGDLSRAGEERRSIFEEDRLSLEVWLWTVESILHSFYGRPVHLAFHQFIVTRNFAEDLRIAESLGFVGGLATAPDGMPDFPTWISEAEREFGSSLTAEWIRWGKQKEAILILKMGASAGALFRGAFSHRGSGTDGEVRIAATAGCLRALWHLGRWDELGMSPPSISLFIVEGTEDPAIATENARLADWVEDVSVRLEFLFEGNGISTGFHSAATREPNVGQRFAEAIKFLRTLWEKYEKEATPGTASDELGGERFVEPDIRATVAELLASSSAGKAPENSGQNCSACGAGRDGMAIIETCSSCGRRVCRKCQTTERDPGGRHWWHRCPICQGKVK